MYDMPENKFIDLFLKVIYYDNNFIYRYISSSFLQLGIVNQSHVMSKIK